jgi:hypothetical protein
MLKNINRRHTFMSDLAQIEQGEHGLKNTPTKAKMLKLEKKEHDLKRTPSMSEMMNVERKEHKGT